MKYPEKWSNEVETQYYPYRRSIHTKAFGSEVLINPKLSPAEIFSKADRMRAVYDQFRKLVKELEEDGVQVTWFAQEFDYTSRYFIPAKKGDDIKVEEKRSY